MVAGHRGGKGSQTRRPVLTGRFGSWSVRLITIGLLC